MDMEVGTYMKFDYSSSSLLKTGTYMDRYAVFICTCTAVYYKTFLGVGTFVNSRQEKLSPYDSCAATYPLTSR